MFRPSEKGGPSGHTAALHHSILLSHADLSQGQGGPHGVAQAPPPVQMAYSWSNSSSSSAQIPIPFHSLFPPYAIETKQVNFYAIPTRSNCSGRWRDCLRHPSLHDVPVPMFRPSEKGGPSGRTAALHHSILLSHADPSQGQEGPHGVAQVPAPVQTAYSSSNSSGSSAQITIPSHSLFPPYAIKKTQVNFYAIPTRSNCSGRWRGCTAAPLTASHDKEANHHHHQASCLMPITGH